MICLYGKHFPTREINIHGLSYLISTDSLNRHIMTNTGNYTSTAAQLIDEDIFFFVKDEDINKDENFLLDLLKDL